MLQINLSVNSSRTKNDTFLYKQEIIDYLRLVSSPMTSWPICTSRTHGTSQNKFFDNHYFYQVAYICNNIKKNLMEFFFCLRPKKGNSESDENWNYLGREGQKSIHKWENKLLPMGIYCYIITTKKGSSQVTIITASVGLIY